MWCKQTVLLVQIETCFTLQFQSKNNETLISWQDAATALYDKTLCVYCFQNKSLWHDAGTSRSNNSLRVTSKILVLQQHFFHAISRTNSNLVWIPVAGTKFFARIPHVTQSELSMRLVPTLCHSNLSPSVSGPLESSGSVSWCPPSTIVLTVSYVAWSLKLYLIKVTMQAILAEGILFMTLRPFVAHFFTMLCCK